MKTVIILAAGIGSRLRPITDEMPKCCIQVGGNSLIKRVISQVLSVDSRTVIYVVGGYLSDRLRQEIVEFSENIVFVENTEYLHTNNMESCRLALSHRVQSGSSLILNADCIYATEIVSEMMLADKSCIAADSGVFIEENMKIQVEGDRVTDITKMLLPGTDVHTSIDIYNFDNNDLQKLEKIMNSYHDNDDLTQWTEVAIKDLAIISEIAFLDISPLAWMEIDNKEDLEKAREIFG